MIPVPLKYHHAIQQQGNLFRGLRSHGVQVDFSVRPQKAPVPSRPANGHTNGSARIDDPEEDASSTEAQWQVTANYQDAEEGDSQWTLKARDQAALDQAQKAIQDAIEQAGRSSHVGFLTLPDRSSFPRIVGSKGSTVSRLRAETGADITVGREDSTIVIQGTFLPCDFLLDRAHSDEHLTGSESSIVAAKDAILSLISEKSRGGARRYD